MKKLLLAALVTLGLSSVSYADAVPTVVSATSRPFWSLTVYNDSGSDLTSGSVVVWDNDDTEFDENGYRYVTTTTTADNDYVAGVIVDNSCAAGTLCEMCIYGMCRTKLACSTDTPSADGLVSSSTVAGAAGAWASAAGPVGVLGILPKVYHVDQGTTTCTGGGDTFPAWVFVKPQWTDE